jgi:hypothetical protein
MEGSVNPSEDSLQRGSSLDINRHADADYDERIARGNK